MDQIIKDLSCFKLHDEGVFHRFCVMHGNNNYGYCFLTVRTSKPKLADLFQIITPQYALKWKEIGILLGITSEKLDIIEHDNFHQAESCCNDMLKWWLRVDLTASWGKLLDVIESAPGLVHGQAVDKGD